MISRARSRRRPSAFANPFLWSAPRLRGRPRAVGNIELGLRLTRATGVSWSNGVLECCDAGLHAPFEGSPPVERASLARPW